MNDGALLSDYHHHGREAAFRELVGRHLALVRGVAWRTLGDEAAAADVAMRVFAIAARKAGVLSDRASLAGWLVVAARQEAQRARRKDHNRTAAVKRYADSLTNDEEAEAWQDAAPHLDAALAGLPETDREAVMLRFYENRNFREIGEALGRGEDAARKRVATALEKLSASLRRRGVVVPVAVLTAGLGSHTGKAGTIAAGTARVAAQALRVAAQSGGWKATAALSLTSPAALCVLTLCTVAGAWWGGHAGGIQASKERMAEAPRLSFSQPPVPTNPTPFQPQGRSPDEIAAEIARLFDAGRGDQWAAIIKALTADQCAGVLAAFDADYSYNRTRHFSVLNHVFGRWSALDAPAAMIAAAARMERKSQGIWDARNHAVTTLNLWSATDPKAATAWYEVQQFPPFAVPLLRGAWLQGLQRADPALLVTTLAAMGWEDRRSALQNMSPADHADARSCAAHLAAWPEESMRAELFQSLVMHADLDDVLPAFAQMRFTPGDASWEVVQRIANRLLDADLQHGRDVEFAWTHGPEEAHPAILTKRVAPWLVADPEKARAWLAGRGITESDVQAAVASFKEPL